MKAELPALQFGYDEAVPAMENNGHTIQVNLPAGQTLTVGDATCQLLQFHLHSPGEEALNGKRAVMVGHFVHKNTAGGLGVIGILMQAGRSNVAFEPVFAHLPRKGESINVEGLKLKLAAIRAATRSKGR